MLTTIASTISTTSTTTLATLTPSMLGTLFLDSLMVAVIVVYTGGIVALLTLFSVDDKPVSMLRKILFFVLWISLLVFLIEWVPL